MKNKIITSDLEVVFIYIPSKGGYPVSFLDLVARTSPLEIYDFEPDNFWNCGGGFEITINGFNTILRCTKFYALPSAVTLLISTINIYKKVPTDFGEVINQPFPDGDFLEIIPNDKYISLSYFPEKTGDFNRRGGHYFKEMLFDKELWIDACTIALDEYFIILERVLQINEDNTQYAISYMKKIVDYWNEVKTL